MTFIIAWTDASKLTQGGLAVVGAAVIGGLLCGVATTMLTHAVAARQTPLLLLRLSRIGGGLAAGFAASLFFFGGPGGWGPGGAGPGDGGEKPAAVTPAPVTLAKQTKTAPAKWLRVVMLGGDRVRGQAFYQVDGESTPRTLEGLKEHVAQLRQRDAKPAGVEIVVGPESVAADHSAVRDLEAWAREAGFPVDTSQTAGAARP